MTATVCHVQQLADNLGQLLVLLACLLRLWHPLGRDTYWLLTRGHAVYTACCVTCMPDWALPWLSNDLVMGGRWLPLPVGILSSSWCSLQHCLTTLSHHIGADRSEPFYTSTCHGLCGLLEPITPHLQPLPIAAPSVAAWPL